MGWMIRGSKPVKDKKFSSAKKTQTGFTGVVTLRL
jgi:hypothetical protein